MKPCSVLALASVLIVPGVARAQAATAPPVEHPGVERALRHLEAGEPELIEDQIELCQIPAPPFQEQARAAEFERRLEELGLARVWMDEEGNVIGKRPGKPGEPVVVISGHLDTVFPEGTDVTVRREGKWLHGPGIADDCRGLAVVLGVAEAFEAADLETRGTVLFVGTVGEEGAGNLRGVRHLFEKELEGEVDYFISVDGAGLDITKDAVASNRYRVIYRGPGGHSYGAFGMPNPIHALGRLIAKVADFEVPRHPKVTFNVGIVEGGTSVNSIPFEAALAVDMRSGDAAALARLDTAFQEAVAQALAEENARWSSPVSLTVEIDTIGIRPGGTQSADAAIVQAGLAAGEALGITPELTAGSTDANLPISLGIPAVTIDGGGRSRGTHSLAEAFDTTDSVLGTKWALLYLLTLVGVR